jgi:lipoprotein LpqH
VLVDGQDQGPVVKVSCGTVTDGIDITIFIGTWTRGVVVFLNNAAPSGVQEVEFRGPITPGEVTLRYFAGQGPGNAEVTKQGNTYKITGTAAGSNATQQISKSFDIDVTCP